MTTATAIRSKVHALQDRFAELCRQHCGVSVEVTHRSGPEFTISGVDADVRVVVAFLTESGKWRLDSVAVDDELAETYAYLTITA
jgi:hypothetical protein